MSRPCPDCDTYPLVARIDKPPCRLHEAAASLADSVAELIHGQRTDDRQICHKGLSSAQDCGRCGRILRARAALVLAGRR